MTETKNGAKYIDKDPPMEEGSQSLGRKILDYLAYLKETLNFIFSNYGRRLTDANGNINELHRTATETTSRLADTEGNVTELTQRTDEIESTVTGMGTDMSGMQSQISQNASAITSEVSRATAAESGLSTRLGTAESRITQTADAITSEVSRATAAEGALSASITQTAGQVSIVAQKLENIGGRNILLNSATVHWEAINSATVSHTDGVSVSEWGCNDAIRATGTGGQTAIMLQLLYTSQTAATLLANRKYVMSCWIKNNSAMTLRLAANNGTSDEIAPGEQKRAVVYADGDGSSALRLRMATQQPGEAFDFIYWHPQIEYGEVVTSWSPAPEDKVGNDEIISKINVSPENITISANKVDLQGYVTFTNLSTSGETAINGGNITTSTISADKLNITDLNAIGATIGGFKIETNSIHTNGVAITSNATNSVGLSSSTFTRTINGTSRSNLKLAIGSNFGVANDGTLYASNGNFTGTITSNNATITGGTLNISGTVTFNASDYTESDLTRIRDYILNGNTLPTMEDYTKYDIDRTGTFTISDVIKVRDMVNGEVSSFTATSYIDIDPAQSNSTIHIWSSGTGSSGGTYIGAGLIQSTTVRTGNTWINSTDGLHVGANDVVTGLMRSSGVYYFYADGTNKMSLDPDEGLTFANASGVTLASYETGGFSFTNAAGVLRAKLDSNGLAFYYGASNGMSAFYPASGTVQSRATVTANSSKTITFSGSTLAIIGMLGSNGNMYGMWTYSGYGSGTARQHINAILGPGGGVSCAIDASTQSVTVTNSVSINCGLYVLILVGSFPTIS